MHAVYNTLIHYGIELILLSALVLIVGLIKPKWICFWMEKPGRIAVIWIASVLFMIGASLFGQGNKEARDGKNQTAPPSAEAPAPANAKDKMPEDLH
jgi:hypothetical protein